MDKVGKETRSRIMRAIRPSNTGLEALVRETLSALGLRFREQAKGLPGTPDFILEEYAVALFADSCFWHGCPEHFRTPKSNREFWETKIRKNKERDRKTDRELAAMGFVPVRVWEHDVRRDPLGAVAGALALIGVAARRPAPSAARAARSRTS